MRFIFQNQPKPIHKLVSPEPHFVEEERNLIENHFRYLGERYESDDVEKWGSFQMDCEGHLVSMIPSWRITFQLTNESIEHLSNFPHLTDLDIVISSNIRENVTNFSLLSQLRRLSKNSGGNFYPPELLKDFGLFTNLLTLRFHSRINGKLNNKIY